MSIYQIIYNFFVVLSTILTDNTKKKTYNLSKNLTLNFIMSSISFFNNTDSLLHVTPEKSWSKDNFYEVDYVRVQPAYINFEHAFNGKRFKQILTIQNCGNDMAFVKILTPSAYSVKIDTIPKGTQLAPGLIIRRTIRFVYQQEDYVWRAILPVQINTILKEVKIYVTMSKCEIVAFPSELDFGELDVGKFSNVQTLIIRNMGKIYL